VTTSNTCFLGPTQVHIPNDISIGSAVWHSSQQTVPILYKWPLILLSKLPHHTGDLNSIDECDSPNALVLLLNGCLFCIIATFVLSYDFLHDFAGKGVLNVLAGALPQ